MAHLRSLGALALTCIFVGGSSIGVSESAQAATVTPIGTGAIVAASKYSVSGRMAKAYRKAGGARKWGAPTSAAKCGLPERACLQHFKRGTLYLQRSGKLWTTRSAGVRGELLIVTRSQVGIKQKYVNGRKLKTKYSRYTGQGPSRWCNHLHSWVAYATGNPRVVPRIADWGKMKRYMKSNWKRLKSPRRGAYIIMTGSGYESHMAMVWMVRSKKRITIIEGNWSKQVNMRTIPVSKNMKFYTPYK